MGVLCSLWQCSSHSVDECVFVCALLFVYFCTKTSSSCGPFPPVCKASKQNEKLGGKGKEGSRKERSLL